MKTRMSNKARVSLLFLFDLKLLLSIVSTSLAQQNFIKSLPGYPGDLPFTLETGYIGVGEKEEVQLFYYFVESERDVERDPLVLWLTGGPGCSGLSTLLFEIGPFITNVTGSKSEPDLLPKLQQNPYSWTKVASIIFIDSPVGAGFSYGTTPEAYYSSDTLQSKHIYEFFRKWLIEHPKFAKNSLFVSGDSYGGMIVPIVVQEIVRGNEMEDKPKLNLKGYTLGNPFSNPHVDGNARFEFAKRISLLSNELYESAMISCNDDFMNVDANNVKCLKYIEVMNQEFSSISSGYVLGHTCSKPALKSNSRLNGGFCWNENNYLANIWADDESVRDALHIRKGTVSKWERCNDYIAYEKNVKSSFDYHLNLSRESLQVLIYSGDHDMIVPYLGTIQWINELKIPVIDDWRPWFVDGQVAGYITEFSHMPIYRLLYATIKGGSHTPADFNPRQGLRMVDRWFSLGSL